MAALVCLAAVGLWPSTEAAAASPPSGPGARVPGATLAVHWPIDVALTAGPLVLYALLEGPAKRGLAWRAACPLLSDGRCAPASLWRPDRRSVAATSRRWQQASDALQVSGAVLGLGVVVLDSALAGRLGAAPRALGEGLVYLESLSLAATATNVVKWAVRRPRPVNYRSSTPQSSAEAQLSFPSGHVTLVAAAAAASVSLLTFRHPSAAWWGVGVGLGGAYTALTAAGRVLGGKHFVSDVLAGAAVGLSVGVVVPWLHRLPLAVAAQPLPGGGYVAATGSFGA